MVGCVKREDVHWSHSKMQVIDNPKSCIAAAHPKGSGANEENDDSKMAGTRCLLVRCRRRSTVQNKVTLACLPVDRAETSI
jgi:hypothetical protein